MVLISSLLLLLVVTILAVAIFRSYGVEEKIAGNQREKQRALHAAESAQQYAEWWLSSGPGVDDSHRLQCAGRGNDASRGPGVREHPADHRAVNGNVCELPWQVGGRHVGVTYDPPTMTLNTAGGVNTYYADAGFLHFLSRSRLPTVRLAISSSSIRLMPPAGAAARTLLPWSKVPITSRAAYATWGLLEAVDESQYVLPRRWPSRSLRSCRLPLGTGHRYRRLHHQGRPQSHWVPFNGACLTAGNGTGTIPACVGLPYYGGERSSAASSGTLAGYRSGRARCASPTAIRAAISQNGAIVLIRSSAFPTNARRAGHLYHRHLSRRLGRCRQRRRGRHQLLSDGRDAGPQHRLLGRKLGIHLLQLEPARTTVSSAHIWVWASMSSATS